MLMLLTSLLFYSCNTNVKENLTGKWKSEIVITELEFAEMAHKEGIPKAFITYAAEDVVLLRNNNLIIGKESLREMFTNKESDFNNVSLTWKPDFVDVSSSGDLGYTYGKYTYTKTDSTGKTVVTEGIFHTVWKRQADGTWKFVWD